MSTPPPLTEDQFLILRQAVNLARDEGIRRIANLRVRLSLLGYSPGDIQAALRFWANHSR